MKNKNLKESGKVEFKNSTGEWKEIVETVCAFANTEGGRIYIGISPSGKITGINIGKHTIEDITNKIINNTDPKIYPKISVQKINGKDIIVIEVKESSDKLVLAFGKPYKRIGNSTLRMSKEEYEKGILEKHRTKMYFDSEICKGATLEDIDKELLIKFLRQAKAERNLDLNSKTPVKEALEKLNLLVNGKLTNAAILLFGKNPQKFILSSVIKAARFKGIEPVEFIDMKVFEGNIIDQREDGIEFIKEHIRLNVEIIGTQRVERWEYPIEAIREAITNAICHRDYRLSGNIQIRIFDDRIEVWGCGLLPEPLTPEDLKRRHKSILRNPLIGRCFFLIKFIEEWGTGTNRMIEWCKKYGLPEPRFEEIAGDFVVTFRKYHISDEIMKELTERQKKIVEYLKEYKKIDRKEAIKLLSLSRATVLREISQLCKKGIIKQIGKGKNTYYVLK